MAIVNKTISLRMILPPSAVDRVRLLSYRAVKRQRHAARRIEESADFSVALSSVDRSRAFRNPESSENWTVGGCKRRAIHPVQVQRFRGRLASEGGGQLRDSKKGRATAAGAYGPQAIVERQEQVGSTRAGDTKLPG